MKFLLYILSVAVFVFFFIELRKLQELLLFVSILKIDFIKIINSFSARFYYSSPNFFCVYVWCRVEWREKQKLIAIF
jgi:hypothetical protein